MLQGPEAGSPGEGLPGGSHPVEGGIPKEFREYSERSSQALPMPGPELLDQLTMAELGENGEVDELKEAIEEALAFREGLVHGASGEVYRFDPKNTEHVHRIALVSNMFTTVETS